MFTFADAVVIVTLCLPRGLDSLREPDVQREQPAAMPPRQVRVVDLLCIDQHVSL